MDKRRIFPVDYFKFQDALRNAINSGQRIDPSDKERWREYVRKHNVLEAAMQKRGEGMAIGGAFDKVIIHDDGEWEGYYVFSGDDQFCLKFDVGD